MILTPRLIDFLCSNFSLKMEAYLEGGWGVGPGGGGTAKYGLYRYVPL